MVRIQLLEYFVGKSLPLAAVVEEGDVGSGAMHGFWPKVDGRTGKVTKATHLVSSGCNFNYSPLCLGQAVSQVVEALRYKAEGRDLYSRWGHWDFSLNFPSGV